MEQAPKGEGLQRPAIQAAIWRGLSGRLFTLPSAPAPRGCVQGPAVHRSLKDTGFSLYSLMTLACLCL